MGTFADIAKAVAGRERAGHKYVRREATGNPDDPWRYTYADGGQRPRLFDDGELALRGRAPQRVSPGRQGQQTTAPLRTAVESLPLFAKREPARVVTGADWSAAPDRAQALRSWWAATMTGADEQRRLAIFRERDGAPYDAWRTLTEQLDAVSKKSRATSDKFAKELQAEADKLPPAARVAVLAETVQVLRALAETHYRQDQEATKNRDLGASYWHLGLHARLTVFAESLTAAQVDAEFDLKALELEEFSKYPVFKIAGGMAGNKAARQQLGAFQAVPVEVLDAVEVYGGQIVFHDGEIPSYPGYEDLAKKRPRGWCRGSTWAQPSGIFRPSLKQAIVTNKGNLGSVSVGLHEFGHAFDYADRTSLLDAEWRDVHAKAKRSGAIKRFWPSTGGRYYKQPGSAGREEFFAETFAYYFAAPDKLKEGLPAVYDFMQRLVAKTVAEDRGGRRRQVAA